MTCDVWQQLAEVRCSVASCDVRVEPILVVTCDVPECTGLRITFLALMKELPIEICFLL